MTYTIEQLKKGLAAYLDAEFMPLIDDGFKRVMVGAGISIAISKYANIIPVLNENKFVKSLELIDSEGNVDLDTIVAAVQSQMPADGVSVDVPMVGAMRFKKEDVEKLYRTIKSQK